MKEENFENAVIATLVGEGWSWIPPELQPVREDYRNPLLREKLATIARLPVNRGLKAQAIAEAIKRIDNVLRDDAEYSTTYRALAEFKDIY